MDPRQPPQHPFPSRNAASPLYSRSPFPVTTSTASSQSPYPPASHAPPTTSAYADHQRRTPENYYQQPRHYPPEQSNHHLPPGHSRHPSASSVPPTGPLNRAMPPPSSPPQHGQGLNPHPSNPYLPPPPRPPVGVGHTSAFPSSRELPALSSLPRTGSTGSSMSISSMLGGPPPPREPSAPPQYPTASTTAASSGAGYAPPIHASPRMHASSIEYPPFRRPQTPEHPRPYDGRDPRGSAAASPQGPYSTPELQRYGTPQGYSARVPALTATEQGREQPRMPVTMPPRPNSQPKAFSGIPPPAPHRPTEAGRPGPLDGMYGRRDELGPSVGYDPERPIRVAKYEDQRYLSERERQERERQERERQDREMEMIARDRRERAYSDMANRPYVHPATDYPNRDPHRAQPYSFSRQPDPREQRDLRDPRESRDPRDPRDLRDVRDAREQWPRPPYEQQRPYDPTAQHSRQPEYPASTAPPYGVHPSYAHPPPHDRYPPSTRATQQTATATGGPPPVQPYESPEHQRVNILHPQHQAPPPRARHLDEGPPLPSVAYSGSGSTLFDSPRNRMMEEGPQQSAQSRSLLAIQEINRNKGRISPLPQAVQGAQPQVHGPAGEPGIKSEFGRMFAGIGSGAGMGVSSLVAAGAQPPFAAGGFLRREDSDHTPQELAADLVAKGRGEVPRQRRRKVKDEELRAGGGDADSTGRATPVGRVKRPKNHGRHHHQWVHPQSSFKFNGNNSFSDHHHHHHHHPDQTSSPSHPGMAPFRGVDGLTPVPSPTGLNKDLPASHHLAASRSAMHGKPNGVAVANPIVPPLVKHLLTIDSKPVLDSVASKPRHHLGDVLYDATLKPARKQDPRTGRPPRYPYKSTPTPLPMDKIEGKENCTLTVKVARAYLISAVREEITFRRAVWGTDIYTDDSDVIAACIHSGWIRGEWPEGVDTSLLGLDEGIGAVDKDPKQRNKSGAAANAEAEPSPDVLTAPPPTGPVHIPFEKDLHVTVLVLPTLQSYASTTRFGLRSREWLAAKDGRQVHDGLSFMIMGIRWVTNGAGAQSRLRGKARRERMRQAMREVELSRVAELDGARGNELRGLGLGLGQGKRSAELAGLGEAGSWWKQARRGEAGGGSEGDKENRPLDGDMGAVEGEEKTTTRAVDGRVEVEEVEMKDVQSEVIDKSDKGEKLGLDHEKQGDVGNVEAEKVTPSTVDTIATTESTATMTEVAATSMAEAK